MYELHVWCVGIYSIWVLNRCIYVYECMMFTHMFVLPVLPINIRAAGMVCGYIFYMGSE